MPAGLKQFESSQSHASESDALHWLTIHGARHNNLKNIDVAIPLARFVCITGVSGSGKSSLVNDILREALARDLNGVENAHPGDHDTIEIGGIALGGRATPHRAPQASGLMLRQTQQPPQDFLLDKVIDIDQSPIGRTPRSNPATYIKLFDEIRDLFARLPDSKVRGYQPGRFSFNVASGDSGGGRCEACEGNGANRVEMDFLADVWATCPVCDGRRFSHETLQVHYRGKSIADVLEMDVQQALLHFDAIPKIKSMLATLHEVGLDYIKLGQSSTTLSGGEAQRIKLARELVKKSTGRTLYILDEPTTGLHFDDIRKLLAVLHGFVDAGNTVIVIEHNLDVIKTADWVIDLGPEGGDAGGYLVAEGTPEEVARVTKSYTGQSLREVLSKKPGERRAKPFRTPHSAFRIGSIRNPLATATRRREALGRSGEPLGVAGQSKIRNEITVIGAKEHNLKDVTVSVPRGAMTVCSGVSGSGKSSFAIDTVYTEGQRRYVESLSAYARQFLGQLQKPKVDHVHGLSPAIAIEQKAATKSPRSTVGTVTEIYDYMRVLWARIGTPHCPKCDRPIGTQTSDEIVEKILAQKKGTRLILCAPMECGPSEDWPALLSRCKSQGYVRVRIDGDILDLSTEPKIDARRKHEVEVVVDRIVIGSTARGRVADSVEHCLALGRGLMIAVSAPAESSTVPTKATRFSQHLSCDRCGASYEELTPHHFSFNSRLGWCGRCEGLGVQRGTSPDAVIVRPTDSLLTGAIAGWEEVENRPLLHAVIVALANEIGFDPATPVREMTPEQRHALLFGLAERWILVEPASREGIPAKGGARRDSRTSGGKDSRTSGGGDSLAGGSSSLTRRGEAARRSREPQASSLRFQWKGFFPAIDEATRVSWQYRMRLQDLVMEIPCQACHGDRIAPQPAAAKLEGKTIVEVCNLSLADAAKYFSGLKLDQRRAKIAGELLHEIRSRLTFLLDVGLDYLALGRAAPTLSGGESQRIRLASQIGSGLTGVLYVLDEPTIGLHPRDNARLVAALHKLRDLGNTLLMVEHDREVIESADHVIDFGPGAGANGGHVVAAGAPKVLKRQPSSLTGQYLANKAAVPVPTNRRSVVITAAEARVVEPSEPRGASPGADTRSGLTPRAHPTGGLRRPALTEKPSGVNGVHPILEIRGARQNNLKNIDAAIPLGRFVCVTGVSGSGKSSLVTDILYPALASRIHRARLKPGAHDDMLGLDHVDKVINVDQQPIGDSPLSNPATYTGVFDLVRELFARLPDAKVRGYNVNRFSFNRPGGRCDECDGLGQVCYEMHFLPDVWVPCETCGGTRYQRETLEVRYKGKNIAEVLDMPIHLALDHFANVPKIHRLLKMLDDVGLGYLSLGQSAPTLSGGEAQRVKLAAELGRPQTGKTVYILDEPTTGLHFDDLRRLLDVLHRLVDLGNTVICIEHNLDVIKTADWIIDLGPEAGDEGGRIVAEGTPDAVAACKESHTGRLLKKVLDAGPHTEREVFDPTKAAAKSDEKLVIEGDSAAAKMPWQKNGRRWHTQERLSHDGKPVEWEGAALEFIVNEIERLGKTALLPTDWNDRARVEIVARAPDGLAQSSTPWFCHCLTGGRWLLDVNLRVPANAFLQKQLETRLALKTLNDRDDIQAYGESSRVQMRKAPDGMDHIRILVHDKKEIATAGFKSFLAAALKNYLDHVRGLAKSDGKAQPWKSDRKAWHLSQKSMALAGRKAASAVIQWKPMDLVAFIGRISKAVPGARVDWSGKVVVDIRGEANRRIARVITNRPNAMRVDVWTPRGALTPTQLEGLGTRQELSHEGSSGAGVTFWFTRMDQLDASILARVVQAAAKDAPEAVTVE